jgi:hypothetical protein
MHTDWPAELVRFAGMVNPGGFAGSLAEDVGIHETRHAIGFVCGPTWMIGGVPCRSVTDTAREFASD